MSGKKLYRSNNRKICGVCGGVAEYFGIDPMIVRLIWAVLAMAWGTSIFLYLVLALIMENRPDYIEDGEDITREPPHLTHKEYINAEPVGFRYNNGVKEEIYR